MKRIPLHRGYRSKRQVVAHAIVDDDDYEILSQYIWSYSPDSKSRGPGYARRGIQANGVKRDIKMHREIMGLKYGDKREVDHINRNTLDNRRSNLRIVTRSQQMQNVTPRKNTSSKFRGVTFDKGHKSKPWRARAKVDGKMLNIGRYATEKEAAEVVLKIRREKLNYSTD